MFDALYLSRQIRQKNFANKIKKLEGVFNFNKDVKMLVYLAWNDAARKKMEIHF